MEELVTVLRKLWRLDQGPVEHEGRFYRVRLRPTSDTPPPPREHLPIHIAGINPRMVQTAGRVADGLIAHPMFTKLYVDEVARPNIAVGATHAGRDAGEVAVVGILMCAVHDDVDRARREIAFSIAQYAASRVYDHLFELHGWSAPQQRIREAARQGDAAAQIAAVPDEAVDMIGVACRPGELADAVARHAGDYDHLDLTGPAWGLDPVAQERAQLAIVEEMRVALVAAGARGA
jgi:alkanesulfonate monooxygenase SsuD/methylene tetrahydromethanopterin reductase-like flavin-dependent oxidoreductase (luciferase family)